LLGPFFAGRPELILKDVFLLDPSYPAGWEPFHQIPPSNQRLRLEHLLDPGGRMGCDGR